MKFDHEKIEAAWWKKWQSAGIYKATDPRLTDGQAPSGGPTKPKFYGLVEFPYPSGEGLHTGHIRSYTAMDIIARKRRMEGYNVLYPIGWDAFGLPTENYAVKTSIHPKIVTKRNTDTFRRQLQSLGFSFDWSREINTTDPAYYKWTQWIFLQMFKRGLAYKKKMPINWCPRCKIGLANEEVVNGKCERCDAVVQTREKEQWLLAITKYADRLLADLDKVDYWEKIKVQQRNWIGKSDGARIKFELVTTRINADHNADKRGSKISVDRRRTRRASASIEIFTTRPDTLFGATFMVLAPEHEIIANRKSQIANWKEVENYIKKAKKKTEEERKEFKEKMGVELKGIKTVNPANKKEIPIFVADYVLASYGTGAIMAVPAHDERDFEFAKKYKLPIDNVIDPVVIPISGESMREAGRLSEQKYQRVLRGEEVYEPGGLLIHSGEFTGMDSERAKWEITKFVGGKRQSQYHLRDWIFSRQRYWGEPIPLVFCERCKNLGTSDVQKIKASNLGTSDVKTLSEGESLNPGWIPVPEKDLPVRLPEVKNFKPTDTGESPLAKAKSWIKTKCPRCGGPARRETDTMPNWAGSSWYFLRYIDPKNNKELADRKKMEYWMGSDPHTKRVSAHSASDRNNARYGVGVDWYNGGMEHTTLHLLYSRFWNKFLHDIGVVPVDEPYRKRTSHGLILGEGGEKMSKSKSNVVNPDPLIKEFGADAVRLYEMFMGPFDQAIAWDNRGLVGVRRFLNRVWDIGTSKRIVPKAGNATVRVSPRSRELEKLLHRTIKKVSEDIEALSFNTAVSSLMILTNRIAEEKEIPQSVWEKFLIIFAPFAPFMAEELYQQLTTNDKRPKTKFKSVHVQPWPAYDPKWIEEDTFELVIQVNGRVRDKVELPRGASQTEAEKIALHRDRIKQMLAAQKVKKIIFVPNRLINIVTTSR